MPRAVRFDKYGGLEVLQVLEVDRPKPGPGKVLVRVKAAGINPGEASIRKGLFADRWPSTFPSGQGSDLAGIVEEVGSGVANNTLELAFDHHIFCTGKLAAKFRGPSQHCRPVFAWVHC